jgi:F0F1-type ATP synthase membrane subunit c/vacuolar-type H+-ATPase subunit K
MLDAGVGVGVAGVGVGVGVGVGGGGGMLATLVEPSPPHADSIRHSGSAIVPLK